LRFILSSLLASTAALSLASASPASPIPAARITPAPAATAATPAVSARNVDYKVTPELENGQLKDLMVEMRFRGDASGRTKVDLPDRWSGADALYKAVHDLAVEGAQMSRPTPALLTLTHAPGAEIVVRYRLSQDFQGAPAVGVESPFRPATQPSWFTAVGWTIFGEVEGRHDESVTFHWGPAPQGWTLESDLDSYRAKGRKTGEMFDSILMGGEGMQVIDRPSPGGGRLRIAIHGKWGFDPDKVTDLVGKIEATSSGFWREKGEDFFVAMTPLDTHGQTVQYGVGLGDAFSLWATRNQDEASLRHILAHEHQHTWLPTRVGGVRMGPDEPMDYWLSEGFTDFYTLRLLLRSGVYSLEDFVDDYNRILRNYGTSPVRDAPDRVIAARFWDDRAVADLPYQRGLLLAALWDDRMRRTSHGAKDLDDVVLKMKDDTDAHQPWTRHGAPNNLLAVYKALGGGDLSADVAQYVDKGARVSLPADMFGDCATVQTVDTPVFERGFNTASAGLVAGVDPQGPAYAAGLRNGMRILKREAGKASDPAAPIAYRVDDNGVQKLITWTPAAHSHMTEQKIVLAPNMTPDKRLQCTRVLAGEL
jgi:predicted metalloprotease with PDZ domain